MQFISQGVCHVDRLDAVAPSELVYSTDHTRFIISLFLHDTDILAKHSHGNLKFPLNK